jgi:hypothetical protein
MSTPMPSKRIYFEVIGGAADGLVFDNLRDGNEARMVRLLWLLTKGGQVGVEVRGPSLAKWMKSQGGEVSKPSDWKSLSGYRVAERIEEDSEMLIRLKDVGLR